MIIIENNIDKNDIDSIHTFTEEENIEKKIRLIIQPMKLNRNNKDTFNQNIDYKRTTD